MTTRKTETLAEFKQRIAIMMRERETGKQFSIVGASRADSCVVRSHNKQERKQAVWQEHTS